MFTIIKLSHATFFVPFSLELCAAHIKQTFGEKKKIGTDFDPLLFFPFYCLKCDINFVPTNQYFVHRFE